MDEQKRVRNEFAIASLVVGITSFISLAGMEKAIVAIVFGALALKRMERETQLIGKKLATAGIILGIFSIIATTVFIVKFLPKIQQRMMQLQKESIPMEKDGGLNNNQPFEGVPGTKLY